MQLAAEMGRIAVLDVDDLAAVGGAQAKRPKRPGGVVEAVDVRWRVPAVGIGERPRRGTEHDIGADGDQRLTPRMGRVGRQQPLAGVRRAPPNPRFRGGGCGRQHRRLTPREHGRLVTVGADDQRHPMDRTGTGRRDRVRREQVDTVGQSVGERGCLSHALQLEAARRPAQ